MSTLINILIIFFVFLIVYQLILAHISGGNGYLNLIEGMDTNTATSTEATSTATTSTAASDTQYQPYDKSNPNNAMILEQKNAGNIDYLKDQVDKTQGLTTEVKELKKKVDDLQDQVTQLIAAQTQYTANMKPVNITGAVPDN